MLNECTIIGAGIAGLTAARRLHDAGIRVTVFEKGRGVGGRMATRRIEDAVCDHGAQFFTIRNTRFQGLTTPWLASGAVTEWAQGLTGPGDTAEAEICWRGSPAMTAVPKAIAAGLDVMLEQEVTAIRPGTDNAWTLTFKSGVEQACAALILAVPSPQALALLDAGGVTIARNMRPQLEAITYDPCLSVMALLDGPSALKAPGALRLGEGPLRWLADNQLKGISTRPCVTLHASPEFSTSYWERREEGCAGLLEAAAPYIGAKVLTAQIHGWRYARPRSVFHATCLMVNATPPLILAGDAFGGPRVEGAALSGLAAATAIMQR